MIRLALGKGRNLAPTIEALRAAGLGLAGFDAGGRRLLQSFPADGVEVLLLKDWDLPVYVEHGIADAGVAGSDVLAERGCDLLAPVRLRDGHSRLSLVGRPGSLPRHGEQVRLATKYPRTAARLAQSRSWSAEVVPLSGSVELAPLLDLADLALDIVQTGRTLAEHGLAELEVIAPVAPCLVVNRAAFQALRATLNDWIEGLQHAEVAV